MVALASAEGIGAKRLINAAYERLSEVYEMMGDFRLALDYYKRFSRFEHEALNEDASRKIKNITVQYEVEKSRQEAEIYRLKNIELKEKTEELEAANRQILAMADTGRLITASLDLDTIVDTLYATLSAYIPFDLFGLALYEEEERSPRLSRLHPAAASGSSARGSTLDPRAKLRGGLPARQGGRSSCPTRDRRPARLLRGRAREIRPFEAGSFMFLPLVIDDRAIGVLTVQSEERGAHHGQAPEARRGPGALRRHRRREQPHPRPARDPQPRHPRREGGAREGGGQHHPYRQPRPAHRPAQPPPPLRAPPEDLRHRASATAPRSASSTSTSTTSSRSTTARPLGRATGPSWP